MPQIKIKISKDGKTISTEVEGIKGDKCAKVDSWMKNLGQTKYSKTSEFYETEQPNEVNIVQGS